MRILLLALLLTANSFADIYHYGGGVDCTTGSSGQVYTTNGSTCSFSTTSLTGVVDVLSGFLTTVTDQSYTVDEYAKFAYTINDITTKLASGTLTLAVKIGSTSVTGLSAISVTSAQATSTASAANSVSIGDRVTLVASSSATPVSFAFTMKFTR